MSSENTGIIIVDHGSRIAESNRMLETVAKAFAERFAVHFPIVEPAHMELASPTIADAYARCVSRGAKRVIVAPFFLGPGRHMTEDIPRLANEAAANHPGTSVQVAGCLGLDDTMLDLLSRRVSEAG